MRNDEGAMRKKVISTGDEPIYSPQRKKYERIEWRDLRNKF